MDIYDPIALALGLTQTLDISQYHTLEEDCQIIPFDTKPVKPIEWTDEMRKECGDRQRISLENGTHGFITKRHIIAEAASKKAPEHNRSPLMREVAKHNAIHRNKTDKMKNAAKNRMLHNNPNNIKVTCPHCNKQGSKPIMSRYHFDNCKFKQHS